MKFFITCCCCLLLWSACGDSKKPAEPLPAISPFESALPHTKALPETELSDFDKVKLAQANGKKAVNISLDSLQLLFQRDTNQLFIYVFWNLDCLSCLDINDFLQDYQFKDRIMPRYELIFINTDNLYPENINSYIRENSIVAPVYNLPTDTIPDWSNQIELNWSGQVPALLMLNSKEGLRLFYQQSFNREELQAVISPLTL